MSAVMSIQRVRTDLEAGSRMLTQRAAPAANEGEGYRNPQASPGRERTRSHMNATAKSSEGGQEEAGADEGKRPN